MTKSMHERSVAGFSSSDTAGFKDKTLKLHARHYHDLRNDTGKEQAMADIQRWIEERLQVA